MDFPYPGKYDPANIIMTYAQASIKGDQEKEEPSPGNIGDEKEEQGRKCVHYRSQKRIKQASLLETLHFFNPAGKNGKTHQADDEKRDGNFKDQGHYIFII
jgi:hypothetical protein